MCSCVRFGSARSCGVWDVLCAPLNQLPLFFMCCGLFVVLSFFLPWFSWDGMTMTQVLCIPNNPPPTLGKDGHYSKHFHTFLEQCFQRDPNLR